MRGHNQKTVTARARGRELLFSGANYMTLIYALIICMPTLIVAYALAALISEFVHPAVFLLMLFGIIILAGAPIMLGAVKVAVAIYRKRPTPLSEIFFAFGSVRVYLRSLCLILFQTLKLAVEFVPAIGAFAAVGAVTEGLGIFGSILGLLTALAVLFAIRIPMSRLYAVVFLALDSDEPRVIRAIGESWRLCRGKTLPTVTLRLSFLPLFLASCIPVGLPLLLYTLPCMLSTYVYYVDRLDGTAPLVAETAEEPETEESETETEVISETETEEIPEAEVIPEIETEENQSN